MSMMQGLSFAIRAGLPPAVKKKSPFEKHKEEIEAKKKV